MLSLALLLCSPFQAGTSDWIDAFLSGSRALESGDLPAAFEDLEAAQRALPGHAPSAYALAGAHAKAGELDAAFEWLERARSFGFADEEVLAWDPDLEALREDPRFRRWLEDLGQRELDREQPSWGLLRRPGHLGLSAGAGGLVVAALGRSPAALYDVRAGELLVGLLRPGERCSSIAVDPNGLWAAVACTRDGPRDKDQRSLRIHDAASGDFVRDLGDPGWQAQLQVDDRGTRLLVRASGGARVEVYAAPLWERISSLPSGSAQAVLSPDGGRVLLVFRRGDHRTDVAFWDIDRGAMVARHDDVAGIPNLTIGFSPDGSRAFAIDSDGSPVHVFDARTRELAGTALRRARKALSACFLGGPTELAVVDDAGRLEVLELPSGRKLRAFVLPLDARTISAASPNGELLLVGRSYVPLAVVDSRGGGTLWSLAGTVQSKVVEARFSPQGGEVVLSRLEGSIELRRSTDGELLSRIEQAGLDARVVLDSTALRAWVGAQNGSLREIDLGSGRTQRVLRPASQEILALDSSRDDERALVLDADGRLVVFDVESGSTELDLSVFHPEDLDRWPWPAASFSPGGDRIIVRTPQGSIRLVDVGSAAILGEIERPSKAILPWCWAPDGASFAFSHGGVVRLHSSTDGAAFGPPLFIEGAALALAFEPDGSRLWVGSSHSKVHVFEVATGTLVRVLDHSDLDIFDTVELGSITIRNDGALAITASSGFGVVAAWDPSTGERLWAYDIGGGNAATLRSSFGTTGDAVYVWGQGSPRVVDAATGATLLDLAGRDVGKIVPVPGERTILAESARGLECIDRASGRTLWSRVELPREGWLLRAASQHVDGSREALERLHLHLGTRSYPLDALAAVLLDPKRVRAAAAGVRVAPAELPALPELEWVARPPRAVELEPKEPELVLALEARAEGGVAGFEVRIDGVRSFTEGRAIDATTRRLELRLPRPEPGESAEYRWRAVASDGLMSRALRLSLRAR